MNIEGPGRHQGWSKLQRQNMTVITFKTPNTVMVFSNKQPDFISLSTDRWEVYTPTLGLKNCKENI